MKSLKVATVRFYALLLLAAVPRFTLAGCKYSGTGYSVGTAETLEQCEVLVLASTIPDLKGCNFDTSTGNCYGTKSVANSQTVSGWACDDLSDTKTMCVYDIMWANTIGNKQGGFLH